MNPSTPRLPKHVDCEVHLELPEALARVCAVALAPEARFREEGVGGRIEAEGNRLHLHIQADSLAHARAVLNSFHTLLRAVREVLEASGAHLT